MTIFKKTKEKANTLRADQETFFVFGYTWDHLGDKTFPFRSERDRDSTWQKYRTRIMAKMLLPRKEEFFPDRWRMPGGNSLRPKEWWLKEAPEPKQIVNGAIQVDPEHPHIFDRQPLCETDREYLQRLNLLTPKDLEYLETESFKQEEGKALEYRKYLMAKPSFTSRMMAKA